MPSPLARALAPQSLNAPPRVRHVPSCSLCALVFPSRPRSQRAAGCGALNQLDSRGQVRCKKCGYRIFYKVRTERMTQFEAR